MLKGVFSILILLFTWKSLLVSAKKCTKSSIPQRESDMNMGDAHALILSDVSRYFDVRNNPNRQESHVLHNRLGELGLSTLQNPTRSAISDQLKEIFYTTNMNALVQFYTGNRFPIIAMEAGQYNRVLEMVLISVLGTACNNEDQLLERTMYTVACHDLTERQNIHIRSLMRSAKELHGANIKFIVLLSFTYCVRSIMRMQYSLRYPAQLLIENVSPALRSNMLNFLIQDVSSIVHYNSRHNVRKLVNILLSGCMMFINNSLLSLGILDRDCISNQYWQCTNLLQAINDRNYIERIITKAYLEREELFLTLVKIIMKLKCFICLYKQIANQIDCVLARRCAPRLSELLFKMFLLWEIQALTVLLERIGRVAIAELHDINSS